jgi:hypothetical protein
MGLLEGKNHKSFNFLPFGWRQLAIVEIAEVFRLLLFVKGVVEYWKRLKSCRRLRDIRSRLE